MGEMRRDFLTMRLYTANFALSSSKAGKQAVSRYAKPLFYARRQLLVQAHFDGNGPAATLHPLPVRHRL